MLLLYLKNGKCNISIIVFVDALGCHSSINRQHFRFLRANQGESKIKRMIGITVLSKQSDLVSRKRDKKDWC